MNGVMLILDIIGTGAFAITGFSKGLRKELDIFGIFVLGLVTAVGGGITRDALLNNGTPVFFTNYLYISIVVILYIIVLIFKEKFVKINTFILTFDAAGLALFAIANASTIYNNSQNLLMIAFFGVLAAVGGGMIRDILCSEVPGILSKDIYASAALMGTVLFYFMRISNLFHENVCIIVGLVFVFSFRMLAIKKQLNLPKPKIKQKMDTLKK